MTGRLAIRSAGWTDELQAFQQFREGSSQSEGDLAECPQSRLACTALQVRDVDLMDSRLLGKVDLPPALRAAQFPDSLACRRADVPCHAFIIGLAFALYLAHPLFMPERWPICGCMERREHDSLARASF